MKFQTQQITEQIKVTQAVMEDVTSIFELQIECGLSNWSVKQYEEEINRTDATLLVCRIENKVVGYVLVRTIQKETSILNFGVSVLYRKKGIGTLLLRNIIDKALQLESESIWLEVRESNKNAIDFYLGFGFQNIQFRKNFYDCPSENALVMKLDLIRKPFLQHRVLSGKT
jgi:[ribosomal protein S18]-alanine N-acetyltransferase